MLDIKLISNFLKGNDTTRAIKVLRLYCYRPKDVNYIFSNSSCITIFKVS